MKQCFVILMVLFTSIAKAQTTSWVVPDSAAAVANPLPPSRSGYKVSKQLFAEHCVICHGKNGDGKGIAASNDVIPADLRSKDVQKQTDGALFWKITTGHDRMIAYKAVLTVQERWEIVNYLRTL